jgi:tripartite ATP-independent transporter DctM subunit
MTTPTLFLLGVMALALASSLWIGFALMGTGMAALEWFRDVPVARMLARDVWSSMTGEGLVTLPLFILMGDILFHTRLSDSLFRGLAPWVNRLPGGLLHVNVLGCTIFAAVSGSSAATTATVGRMTLAELAKRGYDRDLAMGSLAGAGTIGLMIPPSIAMIVYGVLAEASILELFIAGVVPGLVLAALYSGWIVYRALTDPSIQPAAGERPTWRERIVALRDLGPVVFLIVAVIGSMYAGLASVTEAAAVGVAGALAVAGAQGTLTWPNLRSALMSTVRTCAMIALILCGALFLAKAMTLLGVPRGVSEWVQSLGVSPYTLILMLFLVYLVLGCFLDGLSAMVMTLPVALPLVLGAGFDKIWFGIFLVATIELSNVTPPVGFNLFVIQQMTGVPQMRVVRAALPFGILLCALCALLTAFPDLAACSPSSSTAPGRGDRSTSPTSAPR